MIRRIPLNFDWQYCPEFRESYIESIEPIKGLEKVDLPHTNKSLPLNNFDEKDFQFVSYYEKAFIPYQVGDLERLYLCFEGVMTYGTVYINRKRVGDHKGGYTAFEFDVTDYLIYGEDNLLQVAVDSTERDDIPPFGHVIDYLTYGGIYREVSFEVRHVYAIKNLFASSLDVLTNPKLRVCFQQSNCSDLIQEGDLEYLIKIGDGRKKDVVERTVSYASGSESVEISLNFDEVELWSPEHPYLYELTVTSLFKGEKIDEVRENVGFRSYAFKRDGFYLNGKKYKIRGLNRHQSYPYVGYAMPRSQQYKDAEILKNELGVNTVRLSHYPQSRHFLDQCDALGLLVFYELPGWQHIGDEAWQKVALHNIEEMILRDRNRPSVFIWGTRINESQDNDEFYNKTASLAKKLDPSRATGGVRCIKNSKLLEDVYTYNDFSHIGSNEGLEHPSKVFKGNKPYLVTEYNGHMFPTKKFDQEKKRVEQAKRHLNVLESAYEHDEIAGAIGWCMFDYNTHKDFGSGDKICYHGVMDMFRIPKFAASVYQMQDDHHIVLDVISDMNIGEYDGGFLTEIYCLTNCDSVKFYAGDTFISEFYPSEKYKHLPRKPIIIDDFIGERIANEEEFKQNDASIIKKLLLKANRTGGHLSMVDKLQLGILFIKYKMNYLDAENLYTKYFGGWGTEAVKYTFVGVKNGQEVKRLVKGQLTKPSLRVEVDQNTLVIEETYDVTRVVVTATDGYGNTLPYSNDTFTIEPGQGLTLIGPSCLALIGGSIGFYVRTSSDCVSGKTSVKIKSERFGIQVIDLTIKELSHETHR